MCHRDSTSKDLQYFKGQNHPLTGNDTIAAISTPVGQAGIGIIRISGPQSYSIASRIFLPSKPVETFKTHHLYLGRLYDPDRDIVVDEVLLSYMKSPHSYTMEDVIEINSHSGYVLLDKILRIVLGQGARLARPGEFTFRAFMNGRMDLTQAEAVIDIINSRSEAGLSLASQQINGSFRNSLGQLKEQAVDILASVEVIIDFPEEKDEIIQEEQILKKIQNSLVKPIERLIEAHKARRLWIEGVKTVIVGSVNVGKSSLMNRLLNEERAIVTSVPGTTRDVIDSSLNIKGISVCLMDTAGFRPTTDEVESIGLELTLTKMGEADLLLPVIDSSRPLMESDMDILSRCREKKAVVVINKIDLPAGFNMEECSDIFNGLNTVRVSALTGEGMDNLIDAVADSILAGNTDTTSSHIVPNARHRQALEKAEACFQSAASMMQQNRPMEIIAFELKSGIDALGEITGEIASDEVLENIFSRFCLGK